MITKEQIEAAIATTRIERYRLLCFRHPDRNTRAGWQAVVIQLASGWTGGQQHPPEDLIRQTPAGRKISPDESPLIEPACGPNGCKRPEPIVFLDADAE